MKGYKILVPIVLVLLFGVSIYMIYDSNKQIDTEYNGYLEQARNYAKQDIQVDAVENYQKALELRSSFDLYMEVGTFFKDSRQTDEAIKWGEQMIKAYPEAAGAYEYLLTLYAESESYTSCFELEDTIQKRNLATEQTKKIIKEIEYTWFYKSEYDAVSVFTNGYCPVMKKENWGYVNEEGALSVPLRFSEAGPFYEEKAPVVDLENSAYFIDTEGNKKMVVLDVPNVKKLGKLYNDVFSLYNGDSWGLYNTGSKLVAGGFTAMSNMGGGVAAGEKEGTWQLIKPDGSRVTDAVYQDVKQNEAGIACVNDRLFVMEKDLYYMIDSTGKKITGTGFEDAELFIDGTYAAVKTNGKWGFIDADGKYLLEPKYAAARSFANGLAAVKVESMWGFIDKTGKMVILNEFQDVKDFSENGCVFVHNGMKWQLLKLYKYNH